MLTLWLTPAKGALSGQPGQEAKRQVRRAPCPPELPALLTHWGEKVHLTPNTYVGRASHSRQVSLCVARWGRTDRERSSLGHLWGSLVIYHFLLYSCFLYFQNCLKGRKAKLDSFFICSGKLFKSSSASEAWTGVCRSGLGTDGNF